MITCREVVEYLWRYLSDELSSTERRRFETHLTRCSGCSAYLHGYIEVTRLSRLTLLDPAASVPADVPEDLVRAILQAREAGPEHSAGNSR